MYKLPFEGCQMIIKVGHQKTKLKYLEVNSLSTASLSLFLIDLYHELSIY